MKDEKELLKQDIKCPYCKKLISVVHKKKLVSAPVKGEYEEMLVVEKSKQAQLRPGGG